MISHSAPLELNFPPFDQLTTGWKVRVRFGHIGEKCLFERTVEVTSTNPIHLPWEATDFERLPVGSYHYDVTVIDPESGRSFSGSGPFLIIEDP